MVTTIQPASGRDGRDTTIAWRGSRFRTQILVLSGRSLRPVFLDPGRVFFSVLQPMVLLLLFSQVFQSIAQTPAFPKDVSYVDYLVPAIMFTTATTVATQAGVAMTTAMRNGVLARFRSMPVRPVSILIARSVADLGRGAMELSVVLILAVVIFGFGPAGGVFGAVGAVLLALATGWSMGWIFLALATWLRGSETVQTLSVLVMIVLQFASSAFVPLESLPEHIQAVATVNPLSYGITAARELALGHPPSSAVAVTLLICASITTVGVTLAVKGFKRQP